MPEVPPQQNSNDLLKCVDSPIETKVKMDPMVRSDVTLCLTKNHEYEQTRDENMDTHLFETRANMPDRYAPHSETRDIVNDGEDEQKQQQQQQLENKCASFTVKEDSIKADDVDDLIASLEASKAVPPSTDTGRRIIPLEANSSKVVHTGKNETIEQLHPSELGKVETAIQRADIQMTDDDTLLHDVPWTIEQHRAFVAAIFEVGLNKCSPSIIMENMRKKPRYITRERTKSHLQKYRMTKDRNKEDFMAEYSEFIKKTESIKAQCIESTKQEPISKVVLSKALEGKKATNLIGGQAAALLSFSVLHNCSTDHGPDQIPFVGTTTSFPTLTEEEKQTSLGASLLQIKGLLNNLTDVLLNERHGLDIHPAFKTEDYDSQSTSEEEEDYSYFEEVEAKPPWQSDLMQRSLPGPKENPFGSKLNMQKAPHDWTCGSRYHGPYQIEPRGQYPHLPFVQQGPNPPFPPFVFGGPQRPIPFPPHGPYPPFHQPHFHHDPYGHPPPHSMSRYPTGPPQPVAYTGPYGAPNSLYQNQAAPYPQHHAVQFPNHHFSHKDTYPDTTEQELHEMELDPVSMRPKESGLEWAVSKNTSKSDRFELDLPTKLLASPLVVVRKRKRMDKRSDRVTSLDLSLVLDEDRGIPGASKVASPFHDNHSSTRRTVRRRADSDHSAISLAKLFQQSPHFAETVACDFITNEEPTLEPRHQNYPKPPLDKNLSLASLFDAEPHFSPSELSKASTTSYDGQEIGWEPLLIDMQCQVTDQNSCRLTSSDVEASKSHS
ncbi:Myb-like DNA-binding protein [Nitzschia inconspicua]|uniref:Myb-like DNA-binding protein n=1 Tax=Nitzschia inconspicua TaxID=303405 RepID=A0A9K3LN33_9STRA|nr:Myb-like DNA-binding protein [Nitzschia inconspicua]